jgi:signal transduction histidine kinase
VLTDRGLAAALETLAARSPVPVELDAEFEERLPMSVETTAYFVVAEALTNVGKYSGATHAEVAVRLEDGQLEVEVRDDGIGGADPSAGSGLRGLADRVSAVQGSLHVCSPPGRGTRVRAQIAIG